MIKYETKIRRAAAVGMFDGVHLGHQLLIKQLCELASERGLQPTAFSFDCHPMSVIRPDITPKLLSTVAQRADWLIGAGAEMVRFLDFKEIRNLSPEEFLKKLHLEYLVDCLAVGFNHHFGKDRKGTFDDYRKLGAEMGVEVVKGEEYIDAVTDLPVSSSTIRWLISKGDLTTANRLLGHLFTVSGEVVHGKNIGTSMGFPTANLRPFIPNQQLPCPGAYAAFASLSDGTRLPAMINVGTNPTVSADNELSIEAHIMDFHDNLYGRLINLEFVGRLRGEIKFESLDALAAQLILDREAALQMLDGI